MIDRTARAFDGTITRMGPGDVIADRFELRERAGEGAMGTVFRALDRWAGTDVAIKLLHSIPAVTYARFAREAEVLAELRHPSIVRYVAHGAIGTGHYIAMEWLEGTDLSRRLPKKGLTPRETLELGLRVAEALAVAHARGFVHRDVKPANVFLVGGDLQNVKLLDFGIARVRSQTAAELTAPGFLLGTPGYMAPEQARSAQSVDARADVYALGCLMFRCLTGRLPFRGRDPLALLAKVALEEAPHVADVAPGTPSEVALLVDRMIARERSQRPRDGAEVALQIRAIGELPSLPVTPVSARPPSLTSRERRLVFVVLARNAVAPQIGEPSSATLDDDAPTRIHLPKQQAAASKDSPSSSDGEPSRDEPRTSASAPRPRSDAEARVLAAARKFEGRPTLLLDGSLIVTFGSAISATELAACAARTALALREELPGVPIAIAAGREDGSHSQPLGEVIDRAVGALASTPRVPEPARSIALDDTSAALLETRFDVSRTAETARLRGEQASFDVARTVLGRATPFVGRERELSSLGALFEECEDERAARAVLVTAPSGVGKSRLRRELVLWLRERAPSPLMLSCAGEPHADQSPFSLLGGALRHAASITSADSVLARRQKLDALLGAVAAPARSRVLTFLGTLVGVPPADVEDPQWLAAQQNPVLLGDQVRRAFMEWVAAEAAVRTVALIVDDVQLADASSAQLLDALVRNLADKPIFIAAFGRPDVRAVHASLFSELPVSEQKLAPLPKRAAEKLTRAILGERAEAEAIEAIVSRAGGNAFNVEELARAVAEGRDGTLPESVVALVQARISALEEDARRLLRAASIFGMSFSKQGVVVLLGGRERTSNVIAWLEELVRRDLLAPVAEDGAPSHERFAFRQEPLQQAAYATLTEADRALGHQLVAQWLATETAFDPYVVAEHYEKAGERSLASTMFLEASRRALSGADLDAVVAIAERGVALGGSGETLGMLRATQAQALRWRGQNERARLYGLEAIELLAEGGRGWCEACGESATAAGRTGKTDVLEKVASLLLEVLPGASAIEAHCIAASRACIQLLHAGRVELARSLLAEAQTRAARLLDPSVRGHLATVENALAMRGSQGEALVHARRAVAAFKEAGDLRAACMQAINLGFSLALVGLFHEAAATLREASETAESMGLRDARAIARQNLGLSLFYLGLLDEALALEEETAADFARQTNRFMEAGSRTYLARILAKKGDAQAALVESERAAVLAETAPAGAAYAEAARCEALLMLGRAEDALAAAERSLAHGAAMAHTYEGDLYCRLMHLRATQAVSGGIPARDQIRRLAEIVRERAAALPQDMRESFLAIAEHRDALALAEIE